MTELMRLSPEEARTAPRLPLRLLLENVRSAHNVGSAFRTADGNLEGTLRIICDRVHGYGDVVVGKKSFAL